jgi:hypothetical protein
VTSERAIASFRLGLLSLCLCFFTGIPAIIQGIRGLTEIRRSRGLLKGRRLALAGITVGLLGSVGWPVSIYQGLERVRDAAERMS